MAQTSSRTIPVIALAVIALAGCSRQEVSLQDAENLYLEGRFAEAVPVLKEYLLQHPNDAGAHFYLGSSYLLQDDPWLSLAEGEIETALALFERSGKISPIPRFSDTYFELRCYLELAKVYLKLMLLLRDKGAGLDMTGPITERCEEILDSARQVAPDSLEVKQLEQIIEDIRRSMPPRPPLPFRAPPQSPPSVPRDGSTTPWTA